MWSATVLTGVSGVHRSQDVHCFVTLFTLPSAQSPRPHPLSLTTSQLTSLNFRWSAASGKKALKSIWSHVLFVMLHTLITYLPCRSKPMPPFISSRRSLCLFPVTFYLLAVATFCNPLSATARRYVCVCVCVNGRGAGSSPVNPPRSYVIIICWPREAISRYRHQNCPGPSLLLKLSVSYAYRLF